jgi:hypothetical protein
MKEDNNIAKLLISFLTANQMDVAQCQWSLCFQAQKQKEAFTSMFLELQQLRTRLFGAVQKKKKSVYVSLHRLKEAQKNLHAVQQFISNPNNENMRQIMLISFYRSRPKLALQCIPPGSGPFQFETPESFSRYNQHILNQDIVRLDAQLCSRESHYNNVQKDQSIFDMAVPAVDDWLMSLVDAAATTELKKTFFEMTSLQFQVQCMAHVLLHAFPIPPSCQESLFNLFCESQQHNATLLSLDEEQRVQCDFPRGCRHSNGKPSPAKHIQLFHADGTIVTMPCGNPVVWRAGHSTLQTNQSTRDWNANINLLMHTEKDGVRNMFAKARCGHHDMAKDCLQMCGHVRKRE